MKVKRLYFVVSMIIFLIIGASLIYPRASLYITRANEDVETDFSNDDKQPEGEVTDTPDTKEPATTEEPTVTKDSTTTENPTATKDPATTEESTVTKDPNTTENPTVTKDPNTTENPTATKDPNATENPEATKDPNATENPTATKDPNATENPEAKKDPNATENPTATKDPNATENPTATKDPNTTENPTATTKPIDTTTGVTPELPNTPVETIPEVIPEKVFDIEELRKRFLEVFMAKVSTEEYVFSDKDKEMIDTLVNNIMEQYNNDEKYGIALLEKINSDDEYAYSLLVDGYNKLVEETNPMVMSAFVYEEVTPFVNSDVSADEVGQTIQRSSLPIGTVLYENYINKITKQVKYEQGKFENITTDKFRQYDVSIGIDIESSPISAQASNADIVLLIDNSGSMLNNLENAKNSALKFVETVMPIDYFKDEPNAVKITVISYGSRSTLVQTASPDRDKIIKAIKNIKAPTSGTDSGATGTNIQGALLTATKELGINDLDRDLDKAATKKIVILFTDGVATLRSTDIWKYSTRAFAQSKIEYQYESVAQLSRKRFSYLVPAVAGEVPVTEKLNLPDGSSFESTAEETANGSANEKQKEFTERITILEGQHLVGRGVELYTVAFNTDNDAKEFLSNMTKSMIDIPKFKPDNETPLQGVKESPIRTGDKNNNVSIQDVSGRNFESDNTVKLATDLNKVLTSEVVNKFKPYVITDTLSDEFEFNGTSFTISREPFGQDIIKESKWKSATLENNTLTWQAPDDFVKGTYYINFKVKLKKSATLEYGDYFSKGAGKDLYGTEAADTTITSKKSTISFSEAIGNLKSFDFEQPKVYVQPNLNIELKSKEDVILSGEEAIIQPFVKSGTGYYTYSIYEQPSATNGNKKIAKETDKKFDATNLTLESKLDEIKQLYVKGGNNSFVLEVTDRLSKQIAKATLNIEVKEQKLTINILDNNNGNSLLGAFETKVNGKVNIGTQLSPYAKDETYYLTGLGQRQFTFENNNSIKRGSEFAVNTYVPYGYEIESINDTYGEKDGKIIIDLKKNGNNWSGYEQTITIKVKKRTPEPNYFFDWTWILNK